MPPRRSAKRALALLALLCIGPLPAAAAIDPALVARLHRAAQSILAPGADDAARPPRLTDPAVSAAFAAWGGTAALARTAFVAQDIDPILTIQGDLSRLIHRYIDVRGPDGRIDVAANSLAYQDELAILMAANVDLGVAVNETIRPFMTSLPPREVTPIRLEAAVRLKGILAEIVRGTLCLIATPGMTDDNRRRLAAALSRNAAAAGRHVDPETMASLRGAAEAMSRQASAADPRDDLLAFAHAADRPSGDRAR